MKIAGHKTEKSFLTYIKADELEHAMILAKRWKRNERDNDADATS